MSHHNFAFPHTAAIRMQRGAATRHFAMLTWVATKEIIASDCIGPASWLRHTRTILSYLNRLVKAMRFDIEV